MRFVIETAKPIKPPLIIRFGVVMYDDEENLAGEYEISVDLEPYVEHQIEGGQVKVNINAVAVQQHITSEIAQMQVATLIANGFVDLDWVALDEEDEDTESKDNESEANTGNTEKLSPDVPEGN